MNVTVILLELTLGILIIGFCVAIAIGVKIARKRLPRKRERFEEREPLPIVEIYNEFYRNFGINAEEFASLWLRIAHTLKLDPKRLRPTDRFDIELGPVSGYLEEDETADLYCWFVGECKRRGIKEAHEKIQSIDQLILILNGLSRPGTSPTDSTNETDKGKF